MQKAKTKILAKEGIKVRKNKNIILLNIATSKK